MKTEHQFFPWFRPIAFVLATVALLGGYSPTLFAGDETLVAKGGDSAKAPPAESDELAYMKGREKLLDGDLEGAVPFFEAALKKDPDSASLNSEMAEMYLRLGNLERAETLCHKAVEKDPKNPQYRTTLGGIYASQKRFAEAKEQYTKILEVDPNNQKIPLLLGILEAESGNLEAGVKILSKTIENNADSYMAYFYRAKVYLEMEDVQKAKADLDKALTIRPAFVEAGTALGMLQERLGDVDAAISAYSRIQGNGAYKKRLGQLLLSKNEFEKALNELVEYEQLEPDDYTVKVKIGLIYFELKKYNESIARFKSILKEQPEAGNVRFYLGVVYEEQKEIDKAIVEFKQVAADSSFFKEAMLHTGLLYKDQEKLKDGSEFSKKLVASHPDVPEFYDMYASFFEAKHEYKRAVGVLQDGLKRFPKDEKLLYFEGALNDKIGDRPHSIASMKKILELNGNNAHALNFLGYTYAEMGQNLDEAQSMVEKALTLRPQDGYIEDSLGWVYFKKGKIDEAIAQLNKAAAIEAEEPIIYEHLGDVYSAKKDFSKAVDMYKKAEALSNKKNDSDTVKKIENKIASIAKEQRNPTEEKSAQ